MSVAQTAYLIVSFAIGVAQIADAVVLIKYEDKGRLAVITTMFSIVEYIWAAISFFVWRGATEPFPHWLPASFIAYMAAFFAAGLVIVVQQRGRELQIPKDLTVAGGCFGLYFALASLLHLGDA